MKPIQTKMKSTGQGLDYILDEGGSNLSVGEKQLLCLGKLNLRFDLYCVRVMKYRIEVTL